MRSLRAGLPLLAIYVGSVVTANYVTAHYGLVPVGFGLMATAGTWAIGGAILTRDLLQDALGRWVVLAAIVAGAGLSWALSNERLAVASGVTFLLAEGLEFLVYTPLRRRVGFATPRWSGVVSVANVTGAVADTLIFLQLAGFGLSGSIVAGQMVGKLWITLGVVALAPMVRRAVSRQPVWA